jgi:monoamine oxidase
VSLTRRQLLGAAAAGTLVLRARPARAQRPRRVVVVGAGLAGLVCAGELRRRGVDAVVLEARKSPGGRILTVYDPFGSGQHAEAGAEFVEPAHRMVLEQVRRLGLTLEDVRRGPAARLDGVAFFEDRRRPYRALATGHVEAEIGRFWARVEALARPLDPYDPARRGAALDRRSAGWLIDRVGLSDTARLVLGQRLRDEHGVRPARLSLLFLCTLVKLRGGPPGESTRAFRIEGGNSRLAEGLAVELGDRLHLESRVRTVAWDSGGVVVKTADDELRADDCVLALPLPAMRGIEFQPELPATLLAAVERLQHGYGTKVLLQYERRFWRAQRTSGEIVTDLSFRTAWEGTDRQPGRQGILVLYTTARAGRLYGSVAEGARILLGADEVDDVYPGSRPLVDVGASASWHTDSLSGGTFVAYAPGQVTHFWGVLRRPYGRLRLAGDHADAYSISMEGALRSGRRVAAAVVGSSR